MQTGQVIVSKPLANGARHTFFKNRWRVAHTYSPGLNRPVASFSQGRILALGAFMLTSDAARHTTTRTPFFKCPKLRRPLPHRIRVEAGPVSDDRDITCCVCGGPFPGYKGKFVMKYFLLRNAGRIQRFLHFIALYDWKDWSRSRSCGKVSVSCHAKLGRGVRRFACASFSGDPELAKSLNHLGTKARGCGCHAETKAAAGRRR